MRKASPMPPIPGPPPSSGQMRMMLPGFPGISAGLDVVKGMCHAAGAEAEKGGQNSGGGKPRQTRKLLTYATPL